MRVLHGLDAIPPGGLRSPAVAIGVFDGVHRGHRALLERLREIADSLGGEAVVLTFEPHPRAVLSDTPPPRLTSLATRLSLFERLGIDTVLVLPFDTALASMDAERFAREVLGRRIGARAVLLGHRARFGRGGRGDITLLRRLAPELGFAVHEFDLLPRTDAGLPISSSAIRAAIAEGRLEEAAHMLGRPVTIAGRVQRGDRRGRTIGFPTANVPLTGLAHPPRGVYAGWATVDGRRWPAMINIGLRPTVSGDRETAPLLEAHLIGFEGDLYDKPIEIEFVARLRDERRFPSLDALRRQLERDREQTLRRLGLAPAPPAS